MRVFISCLIIIILIVLIFNSQLVHVNLNQFGGFASDPLPPFFPFNSPFNTSFFKQPKIKTKIATSPTGFDARFLSLFAPNETCNQVVNEWDTIKKVNNEQLDFAVVLESTLFDAIYGQGK